MTDQNNLISKIENITSEVESNSIVDRNKIKEESFKNLMGFLNGYIKRSASKSNLKEKVEQMLFDKLESEEEDVPYGVLIKLIEVLSKSETDASLPILRIIESATKVDKELEAPPVNQPGFIEGSSVTTEDIKGFKQLLELVNGLKSSEFTEGEKV